MQVTALFKKPRHGGPLEAVSRINYATDGIRDNVACAPFRHVLLASRKIMEECGLSPGDLRENVIVDFDQLYDLPSGTVVRIGEARIRLTFHCEPCKHILKLIDLEQIEHRRGYLGCFLNNGSINIGDPFSVATETFEAIPYSMKERIQWFIAKGDASAGALDLIHRLGLPRSAGNLISKLTKISVCGTATS